jgi:hypothetical protein
MASDFLVTCSVSQREFFVTDQTPSHVFGPYLAERGHLAGVGVEVEVEDAGRVAGQLERARHLFELAGAAESDLPDLGANVMISILGDFNNFFCLKLEFVFKPMLLHVSLKCSLFSTYDSAFGKHIYKTIKMTVSFYSNF